jgi:predicted DNA-binding transcriptional regulator YafY
MTVKVTYNPTLRLLAALELLQSRPEVSGQELARKLEVEQRSVRRYIMMLRDMGIPIDGERGRHGGYSLRPGFRIPPLMFTAEEVTTVMMGLMLMRELGAQSSSSLALESATAKIERVLPEELWQYGEALRSALILDDAPFSARPISTEQIITFSLAAAHHTCVNITYRSFDGDDSERLIAPYALVFHGRMWYVPAYCFLREGLRVFRLDRVKAFSRSEQTFTPPDDFDARGFVVKTLAQIPATYACEVLFHAPISTVQEVVFPTVGVLEQAGEHDEKTLMRCYADDPHWLARYLARLELPFSVIQPDELRAALRTLAQNLLDSAAG